LEFGVKHPSLVVASTVVIALMSGRASGQSRPLVTEDPETVGSGQILAEAGVDYAHDSFYPASGLKGNLWRVGSFGFNFGVSQIAEIQVKGGLRDNLAITGRFPAPLASVLMVTDDQTGGFPDAVVGAKVRFLTETATRPSMAVKFSTRLPTESNESGLGLATTDFNFGVAFAKTVQSTRMVGNFGLGILSDPVSAGTHNNVINYGASFARAVREGVEVVGEFNGRLNTGSGTPPIGAESRSVMRVGSRYTHGPVRFDAALVLGVTKLDPTWGFTTGLTWVFKAFTAR
jgi:hypothetical protein